MKYGQKKQTDQIATMEKAFAQILAESILETLAFFESDSFFWLVSTEFSSTFFSSLVNH